MKLSENDARGALQYCAKIAPDYLTDLYRAAIDGKIFLGLILRHGADIRFEADVPQIVIVSDDIGRAGGLALLSLDGDLVDAFDMPTLDDGPKGRPAVNAAILTQMIRRWSPSMAYVEFVNARPGEAASGAFAFGRCRGVVEGVLGALGVPVTLITPPVWKRQVGIPAGKDGAKDAARSQAIQRWPKLAEKFARARDDGRAEAALIALAGQMRAAR